jgi:D-alanyl-lipoteichoic acid acyltransferase DltB (MBOAT superfamily)
VLFNSFEFAIFFSVFLFLYFGSAKTIRPFVLLIASYVFYAAWRPSFLALLILTTLVDYSTALVIYNAKSAFWRRADLATALSINLGVLFSVKYLDFLLSNVIGAAGLVGVELPPLALNLVLPIGISFYTFQSVGYTFDVYNRVLPAERNLLYYATYVAFFPQLVAGPIERAPHMISQYKAPRPTSPDRIASGLWLAGWGLFKKVCLADAVVPFVNGVFANPTSFGGSYTLLASLLFMLQIYCDFSGYSDIAIGIARMIGIDLMINFRQPYFATSLTEFWRRWHISLSTWFRDFLYIPLGGNRTSRPKWVRNTILVFGVSGLWHGANWTFLVWGLLHGTAIVFEDVLRRMRPRKKDHTVAGTRIADAVTATDARGQSSRLVRLIGSVYTLLVVLVGWVFFRAQTFSDAVYVLGSWLHPGGLYYGTLKVLGVSSVELLEITINIVLLIVIDSLIVFRRAFVYKCQDSALISTAAAVILSYDIALCGAFGKFDFIYFQF